HHPRTMTTPAETADTGRNHTARPADMPAGYRHDWALYTDWYTAADTTALPAAPETLAAFIAEHPATPDTPRRRMSAINYAHTSPPRAGRARVANSSRPGGPQALPACRKESTPSWRRFRRRAGHTGCSAAATRRS